MTVFPPWIRSRKRVIISVALEVFVFFFILILIKGQDFINTLTINSLIFWIIISYLTGRYSLGNYKVINNLYYWRKGISSVKVFILTGLYLYILHSFFNTIYLDILYVNFFTKLFILHTLITWQINFFLSKLVFLHNLRNSNWLYFGMNQGYEKLKKEIKINSSYINIEKIENENYFLDYQFEKKINGIIIETKDAFNQDLTKKLLYLSNSRTQIYSVEEWCENILLRVPPSIINESNILTNKYLKKRGSHSLKIKRLGDILLSSIILLVAFPLLLIISLLIYLEDKGHILYKQDRVGFMGCKIKIIKFRSMCINAEKDGVQWSKNNDQRITRIGKFIRKTRLDELPQLISVIKGDMTLIGPRPERKYFEDTLSKEIEFYYLRHLMKPGLSGWAQVNYPYGASKKDAEIKLSYEIYYLLNFSILLDFLILIKTIKLVWKAEGAVANN